jgi:sec-independent protein translocase protein TatA
MEFVGAPEILIVLMVVLIIFGPTKLPKLARTLGETVHEFRRADVAQAHDETDSSAQTAPFAERPSPDDSFV